MSTTSNDRRIDEATPDTNVTGVELIPVSDGGSAKSVTTAVLKNYVLSQLVASETVAAADLANDGVYVVRSGVTKRLSASVLADAIVLAALGKSAADALTGADSILVKNGGVTKTTTLTNFAAWIKDTLIPSVLDMQDLEEITEDITTSTTVAAEVEDEGEYTTGKISLEAIGNLFFKTNADSFIDFEETPVASNDMLLVIRHDATGTVGCVDADKLPYGDGNVKGPSANTDGCIPQWNGANTKTLKNGLGLESSITSSSSSTDVPTAAAVYNATKNAVQGPDTHGSNYIPQWDGANSKKLKDGVSLVTSVSSQTSDYRILTEKATATAIAEAVKSAVTVQATAPESGAQGYSTGQMVYNTGSTNPGLYINIGTTVSASWACLAPAE